jgi:hypothetical protein
MIKITFSEPKSAEWLDWRNRCTAAIQSLIDDHNANDTLTITNLYKEQKAVYFDLHSNFYGKCAYCESSIASNQPGDVEHFRPKGRLTDSNNKPIMIDDGNGGQIPHPGYYWLAYHFENLLPSCIDCNRPSRGNSGGTLIGKWDQFPVKGNRATQPGEEVHEQPLLINPSLEDPDNYLEIDELGILHGRDDRGEKCIDLFGLNMREALVNERKSAYENVKDKARIIIIGRLMGTLSPDREAELQAYKDGTKPFSIAGRKAISDFNLEMNSQMAI